MKNERKEKITQLKLGINATNFALQGAVNQEQRMVLYKELGQQLMDLNLLKMNKTGSSFFSFEPFQGYNRAARRKMMKK